MKTIKEYAAILVLLGAAAGEVARRPWGMVLVGILVVGAALGGFDSRTQLELGMAFMFAGMLACIGLMISLEDELRAAKASRK